MTEAEIKQTLITLLKQIAPETEPEQLQPDDNFREKLGIDSFDALRFIVGIEEKTGINIPEEDYGKIATIRNLIAYIMTNKK